MVETKELELINNKELRNRLAERYDVLEKVKDLLLIPETDYCTTRLVANYYEVEESLIRQVLVRNRDELELDGIQIISGKEFKENFSVTLSNSKNYETFSGGFSIDGIRFANRNNVLFTRRAILRIGMLLRDSEVAKEVRTQLLNIEEKSSKEVKLHDLNEEQSLALALGMAYATGNIETFAVASANMMAFKNRHIKDLTENNRILTDKNEILESDNKALANGNLTWSDRSKINYAVRSLAQSCNIKYGVVWNELYKQLKYKYHIDVKLRTNKNYISSIREDEWDYVVKILGSICNENEMSLSSIMKNIK